MSDEHSEKYYTKELILRAQNGEPEAMDILVSQNSPLVGSLIKKYVSIGERSEDLFQIGVIGLIKAIKNFDFSYNTQFSTYAVHLINGELKRHFRDDGIVKVPRSIKSVYLKARAAREALLAKNGCEPTIAEIAQSAGVSAEEASSAFDACRSPDYLSDYIGDDHGRTKEDAICDQSFDFDDILERIALKSLIGALPARERQIIMLRYFGSLTQSAVAERLGMSQVQVSRMEKKVLGLLRSRMK